MIVICCILDVPRKIVQFYFRGKYFRARIHLHFKNNSFKTQIMVKKNIIGTSFTVHGFHLSPNHFIPSIDQWLSFIISLIPTHDTILLFIAQLDKGTSER